MTALSLPRSRATPRINGGFIVAAVCTLPLLLNLLLLTEPFGRDEGAYATIALGLLDGQLPYRDLFDHKPPLIYGWYALSFAVFGEYEWAPRLMGCLVLSATAYLVYDSARILYSVRTARVAALVFSLSTGVAVLEPAANVEPFLLLPLTGMLRLFLARDGKSGPYLLFCAGLLGGLSLVPKEVAIWNVAAVVGLIAFSSQRRWPRSLTFAAGVMLPVVMTAVAFWALGAASEAVTRTFTTTCSIARQSLSERSCSWPPRAFRSCSSSERQLRLWRLLASFAYRAAGRRPTGLYLHGRSPPSSGSPPPAASCRTTLSRPFPRVPCWLRPFSLKESIGGVGGRLGVASP